MSEEEVKWKLKVGGEMWKREEEGCGMKQGDVKGRGRERRKKEVEEYEVEVKCK